jgi:DNA-binding response OmpR family regulator
VLFPLLNINSGDSFIRKKILIIEDNLETQLIFKVYLRDYYDVELIEEAETGLELIGKNNFDLILLDIHLPGKYDGVHVLKEVRSNLKLKTPIIIVTAYAMKGDREKFIKLGADDYIAKPVSKVTLLTKVDSILKNKTFRR